MIQIAYSQEDKEIFKYEHIHHPHARVQQRMDVLWLKSNGLFHNQIAILAGVSSNTLINYLLMYNEGGIES